MVRRMIERLEDMPEGTIGFRVKGEVEREDYTDVLVPALKAVAESGGKLRQLYLIDMEEIEPGALWEDAKTGADLGLHHRDAFEKAAIVTDQRWLVKAAGLFGFMAPGELRVFPTAELTQAKDWVAS